MPHQDRTERPTNKGKKFHPEVLSDQEVQAILRQCNPRYPTGCRNRALITTLYRSGIRISEALQLLPKDVIVGAGQLRVFHGKGHTSRVAGMDPGAFVVLQAWMDLRKERGIARSAPVFCTLMGKPLTAEYVRQLLPRLATKAGIEKRVHAHGLRHTCASQLAMEGVDIRIISKQLGHKSIATTAIYLDHIAAKQVTETIGGRKWEPT